MSIARLMILVRTAITSWVLSGLLAHVALAQSPPEESLIRRRLAADTMIDGVPCARSGRGPAEFHRDGRLAGCAIAQRYTIGTHTFPETTWLDFTAQGTLWGAWLPRPTRLDRHTCRGEGYKTWRVRFHPNGMLALCYLEADTVIAGIPCMRGTFLREVRGGSRTALQLDAAGRPRRCQVARDTVVSRKAIAKWTVVVWDSTGRVQLP